MTRSTLGAVLTGGGSRRMGQDKTQLLIGNRTMLQAVGTALGRVTDRVVVLGPNLEGWVSWPDIVPARGPLAGIATALVRAEESQVLVVAVDQPFLRHETLQHLIALGNDLPVVPVDHAGVRQVTCAVYPTGIAVAAREEAETGGSIQSLIDRVSFRAVTPEEWEHWGEDGRSWFSVDTVEKLDQGLAQFS